MAPAIRGLALLLVICGGIVPASADKPSPTTAGAPIEFSVLTPGLEGEFHVFTSLDLSFVGVSGMLNRKRTRILRELVEREGFDPCSRIAEAVLAALKDAGRTGTNEPLTRRPSGRLQSLSVDELPPNPRGAVMLDITINWIGLRSAASGDVLRPGFSLTWRLVNPDGNLLAPGRELLYVHEPLHRKPAPTGPELRPRAKPAADAASPENGGQQFCMFRNLDAAVKEPKDLWRCFDEAFLAAGKKLVEQLPQVPVAAGGA